MDNIEVKFYDEKTHFLFSIKPDFRKRRLPDWKIFIPAQASIVIPFSLDNIFLEKKMKAGKYYIQIHYGHFDLQDKYITFTTTVKGKVDLAVADVSDLIEATK